ncbi:formylglycine-generating enzyme family protein, partial [Candidatus Poribacteria bacterium]|nr:formylglycine-generating enzyme family protein [Candidatus Poribacteria bacterium]
RVMEGSFSLPGGGGMVFVWIATGTFWMGSPSSEAGGRSDEALHEVEISSGFWLGRYEVTQGQWEAVMGTRPWSGRDHVVSDLSHPAVSISWNAVQRFIGRLNDAAGDSLYRLPSEAEWEYACRAGSRTRWSFGDDESVLGDYAWYWDNAWDVGEEYAHAVGTKWPNAWGLYDMHGNVYEWVQDWYGSDYYDVSPRVDPRGPSSGSLRVGRGGSFVDGASDLRSADRSGFSPGGRGDDIGVRLLRIYNP